CPAGSYSRMKASTDRRPNRSTEAISVSSSRPGFRAVPRPAWYGWRLFASAGSLSSSRWLATTPGDFVDPSSTIAEAQPDLTVNPRTDAIGHRSLLGPEWTRQTASVRVELHAIRREHFRDENDLSQVLGEVFGRVEERAEHRDIASLNRAAFRQTLGGQPAQNQVDVGERSFEHRQKFLCRPAFERGEFCSAMTLEGFAADACHD